MTTIKCTKRPASKRNVDFAIAAIYAAFWQRVRSSSYDPRHPFDN